MLAPDGARFSPASPASASILIRTKNEARRLDDCLEAVFSQEGVAFEVVVLDSGSTDRTVEIARRFPVRLLTIHPEEFTYGYALNVGFEAALHPYLVSLSGHSIPLHRRWLANLLRHFRDPLVAGVSGPEVNRWNPASPARAITLTQDNFLADPTFGFSNFNAAMRREAWERLPFHEALPGGEDKEWAWRMVERGATIIIDCEAAVHHEHQETAREMWRRGHREAIGQAAWRGVRSYSLATTVHLSVRQTLGRVRRGQWGIAELVGAFAYYHGRYTGFTEARRHAAMPGPRQLPRPRQLAKLARGRAL
jgi:glycosyltransferase involved in cell wall biosynthesis